MKVECSLHDDCCFSGCFPSFVRRCSLHARPARGGYTTAPQLVVRGCLVTTLPVVCLPFAQALARLLAAGRRQRMPPTVKDLSF